MGVKKIYHYSDLPDWFNLSDYDETERYEASDWYEALSERSISIYYAEEILPMEDNRQPGKALTTLNAILNDQSPVLFKKTIYPEGIREHRSLDKSEFDHNPNFGSGLDTYIGYVDPMSCEFIWHMAQYFEEVYGLNESGEINKAPTVIRFTKDNKDQKLISPSCVPVFVDLEGSDTDILDEFKRFLARARSYTEIENKKTHITNSDLARLNKYKILPYCDLQIWSKVNNIGISTKVILDVLFKGDEKIQLIGEPFVSQTLKPFYAKALNEKFIRALEHLLEKKV